MNRPPDRIEAHCPRCGAPFVLTPAAGRKKIQCPSCRQTVAIAVTAEAAPPVAEPPARRRTVLEKAPSRFEPLPLPTVAGPEVLAEETPLPPEGSWLRPGHSLRWLGREPTSRGHDEQQVILLHNLRALGRHEIVMETVLEDPLSQPLTERLSAIFREAGWQVRHSDTSVASQRVRGLVLSAAECPLPAAATATYMALKAAGFAITPQLDSTLGPAQSILVVGSASESAN